MSCCKSGITVHLLYRQLLLLATIVSPILSAASYGPPVVTLSAQCAPVPLSRSRNPSYQLPSWSTHPFNLRVPSMSTISAQLRNFKEPDRDEQSLLFFAIPPSHINDHGVSQNNTGDGLQKMEINAVLSLAAEGAEDSYVRTTQL